MTDTVFYDDMNALALELLTDFGSLATLRKIVVSKPDAEGKVTKTPSDFAGLAVQTTSAQVMERLSKEIEAALVFKGASTPEIENALIHAGNTWKVKDVKLVNPEGNRLMVAFIGVVKP